MRRQKYISIGEAIEGWIAQSSIKRKINEAAVINNWSEFAGFYIAKHTQGLRIENSVLYVKVRSGLLKQELMLNRNPLIKRINNKFNCKLVNDIRLET